MHRIGPDCRQDIVYSRALSCLVPLQRNEYRFETVIVRAGICVRVHVQFYCYDVVSEYDVCESACIRLIFPLFLFSPAGFFVCFVFVWVVCWCWLLLFLGGDED